MVVGSLESHVVSLKEGSEEERKKGYEQTTALISWVVGMMGDALDKNPRLETRMDAIVIKLQELTLS